MSLDTRVLYPHFHAERVKHPHAGPSTHANKATSLERPESRGRLALSSAAPSISKTRPVSSKRGSGNQSHSRLVDAARSPSSTIAHGRSSPTTKHDGIPPIGSSDLRSRTPDAAGAAKVDGASLLLPARGMVRQISFTVEQARPRSISKEATAPRGIALRGELAIDSTTSSARALAKESTSAPSPLHNLTAERLHAFASSSSGSEGLQNIVCNARPRSRYARRETIQPLQRIPTTSASTSALPDYSLAQRPSSSSSSICGDGSDALRLSHSTGSLQLRGHASAMTPLPASRRAPSSWTEQDTSSFFLTEIDAKAEAEQWKLARAIARGSHALYALSEYERAVAELSRALTIAQERDDTALLSLLHHHMGVAFKEDGQDRWALMMQKKALELAQACADARLQGRALKALGVLFLDLVDAEKALDCQQQALQLALDTHDAELEARVYANLGNLASVQSQLPHAITCHQRDLDACTSSGLDSAIGQARAHRNLAMIYAKMGDDKKEQQLEHELQAARLGAANAFETDMRRHPHDCVGNIYLQMLQSDRKLADMVASSLQDVLSEHNDLGGC